jgi:hypothetical protein
MTPTGSPTVLLRAVAQRTSWVRLLTGVMVLSIHDPVLQVLDKIHRFTAGFAQQLTGIGVDALPFAWQREQLEWFAAGIAPGLRRSFPDSLWA